MKWSAVLGLAALAGVAFAHPVEHENEKRQSGCYAITGVSGTIHPRLEVRYMASTTPNKWTLYLLALRQYMAASQSEKLSYYQIAGIHGVPRQNWDGVGQCSSCGGTDGYCTHDSVLFPGWHRAYLALFEQVLFNIVAQIAASYPSSTRATMQNAATQFRIPYYDWAAIPPSGQPALPNIITQTSVTVNGPSGQTTFANPLYQYNFASSSGLVYGPFTTWRNTYRYPNSNSANAVSGESQCANSFSNGRRGLQDQVYQLFSTCKDFLTFSNDNTRSSTTQCANSLEGIHNTVHTMAGGPGTQSIAAGHMTYLATSSFDPIFWLHHTNVDRYAAMWQALNPNQWGASQNAPGSTWTIAAGSNQNADSSLTPFHSDSSCNFWTTNRVRNTRTFGYTYPEFANSDGSAAAINSYVNKLYGPSATATAGSTKRSAAPEPGDLEARGIAPQAYTASNGSTYQYVANIETPRYGLDGSYTIYMFLGNPTSNDPTTWMGDANMVGAYGVLSQPEMEMNISITGSVPLTRALREKLGDGTIQTLNEEHVTPYLAKTLQWKIACHGSSVDPATVPGFEVSVYGTTATNPSIHELPVYGAFNVLTGVTHGKPGGTRHGYGGVGSGYGGGYGGHHHAGGDATVTDTVHSATTYCPESKTTSGSKVYVTTTVHSTTTVCTKSACQAAATA